MTREIPEGPEARTEFVVEAMKTALANGYSAIDFASGAIWATDPEGWEATMSSSANELEDMYNAPASDVSADN